jgi:hypothetical protein
MSELVFFVSFVLGGLLGCELVDRLSARRKEKRNTANNASTSSVG